MINFFTELKLFVERYNGENTDGLFFEYRGSKITYDVAEEIYMSYFPMIDDRDAYYEELEEKNDYIRLLRQENARLREAQNDL